MRIMVFGTFDDLHPGHHYLLSQAQQRGETWVVVARDDNVRRFKGRNPDQSQDVRMQAIRDVFPALQVILGDEQDYLAPIREVQPDLILLGYDQRLPPGLTEDVIGIPMERLDAFEPHLHKTSLRRLRREEDAS